MLRKRVLSLLWQAISTQNITSRSRIQPLSLSCLIDKLRHVISLLIDWLIDWQKKISLGDSNNDRQPKMASDTVNTYISETMKDIIKIPTTIENSAYLTFSHSTVVVLEIILSLRPRQVSLRWRGWWWWWWWWTESVAVVKPMSRCGSRYPICN